MSTLKATDCTLLTDYDGGTQLVIKLDKQSTSDARKLVNKGKQWLKNGKPVDVDIRQHREKRSIDANAYMWLLLDKMAKVLHTDKESLYVKAIKDYGVFTHLIVKPCAVERLCQEWRATVVLGDVEINGKKGVQVQAYYGSSQYDREEMARLIDGVVDDAKELGIETLTPDELSLIKNNWRKAHE